MFFFPKQISNVNDADHEMSENCFIMTGTNFYLLTLFKIFQVYQPAIQMPKTGCFYPPTLITNVQTVSKVVEEEVSKFLNT